MTRVTKMKTIVMIYSNTLFSVYIVLTKLFDSKLSRYHQIINLFRIENEIHPNTIN